MRTRFCLGSLGLAAAITLLGQLAGPAGAGVGDGGKQPDLILGTPTTSRNWGKVGDIHGLTFGSDACNIGEGNLFWGRKHQGSPVLGMNVYRLEDGRLLQIGQSFAKHSQRAIVNDGCGLKCNGVSDDLLGSGCRDLYTAEINGLQTRLGPRSAVNAWTGELGEFEGEFGNEIFRRIQLQESDIDRPDALFFAEGVYVGLDDAGILGNGDNNSTYRRAVFTDVFEMNFHGFPARGIPAIYAWHDHGNGVGVPDPAVLVQPFGVPGEGLYFVASKVVELENDEWRYEYAIFNLNSDRAAGRLTVPMGLGANVSDIGFHDVDYHSGEKYDNTDWTPVVELTRIEWRSPATYDENPNSNALRWGTMYNFWFTSDAPPGDGTAWINLFKPGTPTRVSFAVPVPVSCGADLDDDGTVGFNDLLLILAVWGPCDDCPEDLDQSGSVDFVDLVTLLAEWGPCP